jgi:error-prone DNA polymerase
VAERDRGGAYRTIEDLAARAGAGRPALEQLAWSGACDRLVVEAEAHGPGAAVARRTALWQLGVAAPATPVGDHGMQLALSLDLPAAPALAGLNDWDAMVADYATTGMTVHRHPFALLREHLTSQGAVSSRTLEQLRHGTDVQLAGLVMARQKPGTANGVCFLLLEDEFGTVNLIVPPPVYERDRLTVRSEPLVIAEGRMERYASAGGAINVVVRRLRPLEVPTARLASVHDLPAAVRPDEARDGRGEGAAEEMQEAALAAAGGGSAGGAFRAVAPPVQSFARGRSR